MASARLAHHSHHSHGPPPASSGQPAGTLLFQKSHVVAGVQDAYWSDDEEEEPECPLCVGEMDMDDLNFKPCPCGYQRFVELTSCPARLIRESSSSSRRSAVFVIITSRKTLMDDALHVDGNIQTTRQKRLNNQKKQKEKEKKELEALKRSHLPNMRVVQRNVVYVTGLGPRFAKEELIPSLRSHEYFGQYGKISKILLVKRSGTATRDATTGIYITYNRREDAARAIAGVDGSPSPGGGGEVMRASYGTTKYCMNFLRNITCTNPGCMELHEWGDEKDSFTKEDLATLKHALKDTETRQKYTVAREADSLPRGASWATKGASPKPSTMAAIPISTRESRSNRGIRTTGRSGTSQSARMTQPPDVARPSRNAERDRSDRERERDKERDKKGHSHTSSSGSAGAAASAVPARAKSPLASSRPSTPASSLPRRPPTATDAASSPSAASSPASSTRPTLPPDTLSTTSIPQRLIEAETSSTPPPTISTPAPPSEPSVDQPYRLSGNVQALLDDVVNRRETKPQTFQSPFPDLDRTLAALGNDDYSFSFNLDPKLIPPKGSGSAIRSGPGRESPGLYGGFDPFGLTSVASPPLPISSQSPALPPPPGLVTRSQPVSSMVGSAFASPDSTRNSYTGSFDPFAEPGSLARETAHLMEDETARRGSRFGFAQRKASDSRFSSAAASPMMLSDNLPQAPLYASSDLVSPAPSSSQTLPQWTYPTQQQDFSLAQGISQLQLQANAVRAAQQPPPGFGGVPRFSPFGTSSNTEAALKEMLNIGRSQQVPRREPVQNYAQQGFNDPAIMSMRMSNVANGEMMFQQSIRQTSMMDAPTQVPFGAPPPGLVNMPPPGLPRATMNNRMANGHVHPSMQSLNAQQVSEYPPFPQFSPSTSAALVSPALAAISPLVSSSLSVSSPIVASSSAASSHTPAFTPSDFPELSSIPAERERPRRENSATHSKKPEGKANRKTSVSQTPALPSLASAAPSSVVKQEAGPASPKPEPNSDVPSVPSTTPAQLKGDAESDTRASPVLATPSIGRAIVPLDLPAAVPPLSRKQKRLQAKMQAKEKVAPPSSTHSMSTPASRVPSPPPVSPPVTHQVSQVLSDHSAARNHTPVVDDKSTSSFTLPTAPQPVTAPAPESQESKPTVAKSPQQSQPPSLKVAIGPPASVSQLPNPSPAPSEPDAPASAVTETAPESATVGLSKKQRKILAAKAAREAAEAKALEAAKAQVTTNETVSETPYANLVSAKELLHPGKGVLHEEYPAFLNHRSLEGKGPAAVPYAPLVDALTVLSIGNGAFADGMPSSSSAIASFQQLLETLTQAISELLRLLPGITWADNSSFDSAILDILKAEDFMAEGTHIQFDQDSDVETLTLALEKRAKWMKTQLTKLEELHRDINSAAVRAVLSLNDRGWDARTILNKSTGSLERFEQLGTVLGEGGAVRGMSLAELTEALKEARRQESEVEMQLKEMMKLNAPATS
ncbi:transcriptional repressor general negative regulator of transcription subunit 4 [Tulasnella sp. 417]|nr:transcriptional repressor general negative regulator of transcription subunit 4 [Tulasnella sp. 417]